MSMWQVYWKIESPVWGGKNQWIEHGSPTTKEIAEAIVAQLSVPLVEAQKKKGTKSNLGYNQPHCVPI